MSKSANVLSVQTLKDFKIAMCNFAEDARNSLSGVDMELRRMRDWLERDQPGYWQPQIKKRQEDMMQARADLHKRKISQQGSDAVSDAEQKEALRDATRRLRVAEEQLAKVKRFDQIGAGAELSCGDRVIQRAAGGDDEHRRAGARAIDRLQHTPTADIRQAKIQNNQRKICLRQLLQSALARGAERDFGIKALANRGQRISQCRLVFNNQNLVLGHRVIRTTAPPSTRLPMTNCPS